MKLSDLYIRGLGIYLPPGRTTPELTLESRLRGNEYAVTDLDGVAVADRTSAVEMAVQAASNVPREGGMDAKQVDLVIYAPMLHQGPDGWCPAGYIVRELGCGDVAGYEILQGCSRVLAGLDMAVAGSGGRHCPSHDGRQRGGALARPVAERGLRHRSRRRSDGVHPRQGPRPGQRRFNREYSTLSGDTPVELNAAFMKMYSAAVRQSPEDAGIRSEDVARVIFANVGAEVTAVPVMQLLGLPMSRSTSEFGRTIGHIGGGITSRRSTTCSGRASSPREIASCWSVELPGTASRPRYSMAGAVADHG